VLDLIPFAGGRRQMADGNTQTSLCDPSVHPASSPTAQALAQNPSRRPGSGYSWRKPFLRRPPSSPARPEEVCAKK